MTTTTPRRRNFDHALALMLGWLIALAAFAVAERIGLCVEPDRPESVNAGVQPPR